MFKGFNTTITTAKKIINYTKPIKDTAVDSACIIFTNVVSLLFNIICKVGYALTLDIEGFVDDKECKILDFPFTLISELSENALDNFKLADNKLISRFCDGTIKVYNKKTDVITENSTIEDAEANTITSGSIEDAIYKINEIGNYIKSINVDSESILLDNINYETKQKLDKKIVDIFMNMVELRLYDKKGVKWVVINVQRNNEQIIEDENLNKLIVILKKWEYTYHTMLQIVDKLKNKKKSLDAIFNSQETLITGGEKQSTGSIAKEDLTNTLNTKYDLTNTLNTKYNEVFNIIENKGKDLDKVFKDLKVIFHNDVQKWLHTNDTKSSQDVYLPSISSSNNNNNNYTPTADIAATVVASIPTVTIGDIMSYIGSKLVYCSNSINNIFDHFIDF